MLFHWKFVQMVLTIPFHQGDLVKAYKPKNNQNIIAVVKMMWTEKKGTIAATPVT